MKTLGAIVLAVGCVTACSWGDGPLQVGDGHMTVCQPQAAKNVDATLGNDVITNTGKEAMVIKKVSTVEAIGLKLADAVIMPIHEQTLVGVAGSWPPKQAAGWGAQQPAVGYSVPPKSEMNLVVHLVRDQAVTEASLKALRVEYTIGHRSYQLETNTTLNLRPRCS
ncbi:hypothetical protein HPO96_13515 [Kribbella sandramycini]|uniref:Uncharacterized protein n=1 Tax=Kribbella sandramycini TaxID=60450 RepID=A0A7Y4KZ02_9ACTN|nr:hypothetical protein [Kribbella sandramycini]MBB6564993.1 hypothetical protein [Kribbella sandramycini]NOL41265.1 hypothetical protein [Kribbella sandramycini]